MVSTKVFMEGTGGLCKGQVIISSQGAVGCGRGRGLLKLGEAARKRWMGRECGEIGPAVRFTIGATASHSDGGRHEGKRRGHLSLGLSLSLEI